MVPLVVRLQNESQTPAPQLNVVLITRMLFDAVKKGLERRD